MLTAGKFIITAAATDERNSQRNNERMQQWRGQWRGRAGDDGVMSAGVLRYIQEPVVEMIDTNIAPLASAASVTRPLVRDLIGANNQTDSHRSSSWFKFTAALINLTLQQFSSAVSILFRWIWFCLLYIADYSLANFIAENKNDVDLCAP